MSTTLTAGQRKTLPARDTFAATFSTPEEKSNYYRRIGEKGNRGRLTLSGNDVAQLRAAHSLLARLAAKADLAVTAAATTPDDTSSDDIVVAQSTR